MRMMMVDTIDAHNRKQLPIHWVLYKKKEKYLHYFNKYLLCYTFQESCKDDPWPQDPSSLIE